MVEAANRRIFNLLGAIFRGNHASIDFSVSHGSTGLAKFVKRSKLGDKLKSLSLLMRGALNGFGLF